MPPDEAHGEESDAENWRQERCGESNRVESDWPELAFRLWVGEELGFWGFGADQAKARTGRSVRLHLDTILIFSSFEARWVCLGKDLEGGWGRRLLASAIRTLL